MDKKTAYKLIAQEVNNIIRQHINENLFTHNDEYNLLDKLDEYDITYDFINENETIIEIRTRGNQETAILINKLLNYYGWMNIKETKFSIFAERKYGDLVNNYIDEDEDDYPTGIGIFYHITPTSNVEKILRRGLLPRESQKLGYSRGKRIYLLSYPSDDFARQLFRNNPEINDITILKVDISEYIGKNIDIYHDDFTSDDGAVFTYDYIPAKCIEIYKEIKK